MVFVTVVSALLVVVGVAPVALLLGIDLIEKHRLQTWHRGAASVVQEPAFGRGALVVRQTMGRYAYIGPDGRPHEGQGPTPDVPPGREPAPVDILVSPSDPGRSMPVPVPVPAGSYAFWVGSCSAP